VRLRNVQILKVDSLVLKKREYKREKGEEDIHEEL
jgi:hypothetical protein